MFCWFRKGICASQPNKPAKKIVVPKPVVVAPKHVSVSVSEQEMLQTFVETAEDIHEVWLDLKRK